MAPAPWLKLTLLIVCCNVIASRNLDKHEDNHSAPPSKCTKPPVTLDYSTPTSHYTVRVMPYKSPKNCKFGPNGRAIMAGSPDNFFASNCSWILFEFRVTDELDKTCGDWQMLSEYVACEQSWPDAQLDPSEDEQNSHFSRVTENKVAMNATFFKNSARGTITSISLFTHSYIPRLAFDFKLIVCCTKNG